MPSKVDLVFTSQAGFVDDLAAGRIGETCSERSNFHAFTVNPPHSHAVSAILRWRYFFHFDAVFGDDQVVDGEVLHPPHER